MDSSTTRARSGNRRDDAARLAVLHAADDLLVENGFAGLTVEAIARRAGVAKQTIYRWWPSKVEILLDTLIEDTEKRLAVPAGAPTAKALRGYVNAYVRFVTKDPAGAVLVALLAHAQHDSVAAQSLRARYLEPRRRLERDLLTRAVAAGVIAPTLPPDAALDALFGPIVYRTMLGEANTRGFVDTLVTEVLRPQD